MSELADRLTRIEGKAKSGSTLRVRPRDAATLVLLDHSHRHPRVLVGRRHDRHAFMPGKFVFPGGAIHVSDGMMPTLGALDPDCERRLIAGLTRASPRRARAFALAAIRETCEETGLLIGRKNGDGAPLPSCPPDWAAFVEEGVAPDLSMLSFVARAITPPGRPRRFDTRFFLADRRHVAAEIEDAAGPESEFVELKWMRLSEAKNAGLPTISKVVLTEIERRLAAPRSNPPVPFYFFRRGRFWREEIA
jgi:8-oxo-dGTP pyrophosphatase MutT (NUDIX family)